MHVSYNFKNFEPSDHLKEYAAARFGKLNKYASNPESLEVQVNLAVEKIRQMAEVIVSADDMHLSAYEETQDMYATIDKVADKVVAQAKRLREKRTNVRRGTPVRLDVFSLTSGEGGVSETTIVESDKFEAKPMDVIEAAEQLSNLKYEFLVFHNAETERVNVIYRRKNGEFALIDPGF